MQDMLQGDPAKNKKQRNALSHTAANSRPSHSAARSSTWEKTHENTVLVVALPTTYPLASGTHSLVLPPAPGLLILGPAPGENTVLFPASAKHSLQGLYPAARSRTFEKAKENTVFVLALWFHAACTNTFGPSWIASDHDLS